MSVCTLGRMGVQCALELTLNIAGWVILADKELGCIPGPVGAGEGGARDEGTPKLRGTFPNNLGEVRELGVLGIVILGFIIPIIDPIGDGFRLTVCGVQVLCKFEHEYPEQPGATRWTTYPHNLQPVLASAQSYI